MFTRLQTKTYVLIFILVAVFPVIATAQQPVVTQISNAASASLDVLAEVTSIHVDGYWLSLPNASIAQGSYFSVYGSNFGTDSTVCGSGFANCFWDPYPLPTVIQGTSVSVTVGSTTVAAYIEFAAQTGANSSQINAVLPSTTPTGPGTLTVAYNGLTSTAVPINVVASSFGTFSFNESGSGPGIVTDVNYVLLTPFHTAKPGDYVILWGTGMGPAPNIGTEGTEPPPSTPVNICGSPSACPITVWVGGQQTPNLYYAGRSLYTAEDQLIFQIPQGVQGCYVQVAIATGTSYTSNFTSIPVDPNGAYCSDSDGISMTYIGGLFSSGTPTIGVIGLNSQYWNTNLTGSLVPMVTDTVTGVIGQFSAGALELFSGFTDSPSVNNCAAVPYLGYPPPIDAGLGYVTYLDAGPALSAQNPTTAPPVPVPEIKNAAGTPEGYYGLVGGCSPFTFPGCVLDAGPGWMVPLFFWNATPNGDGTYTVNPPPISGNYTVTAPGGASVGAFTATMDVSSAATSLVWTNADIFDSSLGSPTVSRSTPLNITWSGGDPNGFVDITLIGSTAQFTVPLTGAQVAEPGVQVECIVPTSAGTFTVPTYVLQALPPTAENTDGTALVMVGPISAPVKITPTPSGLDALYMYYRFLEGYTVVFE